VKAVAAFMLVPRVLRCLAALSHEGKPGVLCSRLFLCFCFPGRVVKRASSRSNFDQHLPRSSTQRPVNPSTKTLHAVSWSLFSFERASRRAERDCCRRGFRFPRLGSMCCPIWCQRGWWLPRRRCRRVRSDVIRGLRLMKSNTVRKSKCTWMHAAAMVHIYVHHCRSAAMCVSAWLASGSRRPSRCVRPPAVCVCKK